MHSSGEFFRNGLPAALSPVTETPRPPASGLAGRSAACSRWRERLIAALTEKPAPGHDTHAQVNSPSDCHGISVASCGRSSVVFLVLSPHNFRSDGQLASPKLQASHLRTVMVPSLKFFLSFCFPALLDVMDTQRAQSGCMKWWCHHNEVS